MTKVALQEDKKTRRQVPFSVFSKKGLVSLVLAGAVISSPFYMLAGCSYNGKDGAPGTPGTIWKAGIDYTQDFPDAKNGDFFIDTDDYILYQKTGTGWSIIMENYGKNGKDGISGYVGYDGYVWTGTERSSYKVNEAPVDDYLVTDAIGLINHSKYFNSSEIDMNNNQVALMDYYFENINKTNYSGLDIATIDIYSTNTGTLTIGTANVETAIASKKTGTPVELNNKKTFSLQQGINSLNLNLKIGETATLVLDKLGDTATLLSYSGIPAKDNMGEHLIITNGEINTDSIKEYTDSVANKLVIKTTINNIEHSTISSFINKDLKDTTEYRYSTTLSTESYFSQDYMSLIEGKTLTKVDFPLYTVPSIDEDQYLTFYVVGGLVPDNAPTYVKEYKVCITKEQLTNAILVTNENYESLGFSDAGFAIRGLYFVGEWITATKFYDVENDKWIDELTLLGDQNIAWQKIGNNDVSLMFKDNAEQENLHQMGYLPNFGYYYDTDVLTKVDLHVNWYVKNYNYSTHLKQLYDANQEIILKNLLSGKSVSILGDSISTYSGVSEVESPWYGQGGSNTILKQAETWWQQLIDSYNMELLVNDSVGGAGVYTAYDQTSPTSTSGYLRADNLKTNTENPDYVFVFMGANDKETLGSFDETISNPSLVIDNENGTYSYATPNSFADACYIMLHKIKKQNPNAKIYYLLPYTTRAQSKYNAVISEFCDYLNIYTIDLGETELINYSGNLNLVDGETSCHPNATGMDLITNKIIEELKKQLIN